MRSKIMPALAVLLLALASCAKGSGPTTTPDDATAEPEGGEPEGGEPEERFPDDEEGEEGDQPY